MAVVIASNLRMELAGNVLFDGVSFKVERSERVALAGPNGAGKTTLLRMLAGQSEVHGGELAFSKGTRVALHDQRPPLQRGLTLRDYLLAGAADLVAIEQELRRLEEAMASGEHDAQTLRRYSEAQARLEHAGGYAWRERVNSVARGLGFQEADLDRLLDTFSGGELTRASLARALGGDPDLLLLDEPTNHLDVASLEWLESELSSLEAGVILVAHDLRRGAVAPMATREGGPAAVGDEGGGPLRGGHRAPRALRRPVPLQEVEGEAGSGKADANRPTRRGEGEARQRDLVADAPLEAAGLRLHRSAAQWQDSRRGRGSRLADRRTRAPA